MVRKQRETREMVWRERLARFERSGLSVREFCRKEGCSDPAFYQWRKRLRKRRPRQASGSQADKTVVDSEAFVPVTISPSSFAEVEFPNGVRIRVPATDAEALRVALTMGRELCKEA
jgi:transposase